MDPKKIHVGDTVAILTGPRKWKRGIVVSIRIRDQVATYWVDIFGSVYPYKRRELGKR